PEDEARETRGDRVEEQAGDGEEDSRHEGEESLFDFEESDLDWVASY
ncbi:hypothetical protein HPC50_41905, partial [Corallococcus exiguus]|nr:hypothetical protein [Corallococcus exiguus]